MGKICGVIAADEARHAKAYQKFIELVLGMDPNGLLLSFQEMMKRKVVMPAHNLRGVDEEKGNLFKEFSFAAQRTNVYTTQDYIEILISLLEKWKINDLTDLSGDANKAQDYLLALPARLERISSRMSIPQEQYKFKWIA